MNFLVSHTCEIRFHDVISRSTEHMYSNAEIPKHGILTRVCFGPLFLNLIHRIQLCDKKESDIR